MATARPVARTQPHLARLRVERQHRLIEELRRQRGCPAIASVTAVGPDISATARSALTRLLEALSP